MDNNGGDQTLERLLDRLIGHFAQRREALDVIGRCGNRGFEDWVKWEAVIGLHIISYLDTVNDIESIQTEREDCDLFVGPKEWPESGYPDASPEDIWIEIKARNTWGGQTDLVKGIQDDLEKQALRKRAKKIGHFVVLAFVVAHPRRTLDEDTLMVQIPDGGVVRKLYHDDRYRQPADDYKLLATLVGWEV